MDAARYYSALFFLVGLPPGLIFWFVVHPFVVFWRQLGPGLTYGLVGGTMGGLGFGLYYLRGTLLATEFGLNSVCVGIAVVCLAGSGAIAVKRSKYLTLRIMVGVPELASQGSSTGLLSQGIYARIRHPRYVEIFLCVVGVAFFSNYLAIYVLAVLSVPVIYGVVVLEERELHDRFGHAYAEYCRQVPRFIPRFNL